MSKPIILDEKWDTALDNWLAENPSASIDDFVEAMEQIEQRAEDAKFDKHMEERKL